MIADPAITELCCRVCERQSQTLQHGEKLDQRVGSAITECAHYCWSSMQRMAADSASNTNVRVANPILENEKYL